MYINQKYMGSLDWIMLEIKLPREINKSPLATEVSIAAFLQSAGASTKYARNFEGKVPHFGSLEIASIEGTIHFYIRIQRRFRTLFETNFYAQYPGIEIFEADDYTKKIRFHHLSKDVKLWGMNYRTKAEWTPTNPETGEPYKHEGKTVEMKADFLPIKTYVDFGLDKDPKEEYKTDPIAPLLEMMSSIGKGEHMWYQILIQDESVYDGKKMPKLYVNKATHEHVKLKDMADARKKQIRTASWNIKDKKVVDEFGVPKIIDSYNDKLEAEVKEVTDKNGNVTKVPVKKIATHKETKAVSKKEMDLTGEEKEEIEIINKKFSKPLAATIIRIVYVANSVNFKTAQIANTLSYTKHFSAKNILAPGKEISDPYDYPWQKLGGRREFWRAEELFEAYVEREGFFPHVKGRDSLDEWEDVFFWTSSMKQRKIFRMVYEAIFHPFDHPTTEDIVCTLNLEEIATLWHLPGTVSQAPGLPRIDSNKGIAPSNLPL